MARRTNKTTDAEEWQDAPFSEEEIEFSPFMFDKGQDEAAQQGDSPSTASGVPPVNGGQFSDADMEFEPFMFDQGAGTTSSGPLSPVPASTGDFAPFSTSPFADPAGNVASPTSETAGSTDNQTASGPITGSDLPLPSYLASDPTASSDSAPVTPEMAAAPPSVDVETQDAPASSTPDLTLPAEPVIVLPEDEEPDMGTGSDEQLTGRVPSGPLTELPASSTSTSPSLTGTSPNLGRVRGNTGPLGPLPPDRTGSSNTSWSDSSLASIEDFSSILIALHAGKKLRQSGSLTEGMVGQASPSATTAVQDAATGETSAPSATMSTPEHMGVASQVQDMPEWAVQATQSSPLTPEMAASPAQTDTAAQSAVDEPSATPEAAPAEQDPYVDPIHYRQVPADSVLNQLEPNIAQALKSMDSSVAHSTISGDELEFEGFMFDTGASTPMASLSTSSPEELAALASELGPAFDPAQYSSADTTDTDSEEASRYADIDPALFEGLTGTAHRDVAGDSGAESKGALPFWLQFEDSPPASGPLAEEDLSAQSTSAAQAAGAAQGATSEDSAAFADLPPIEPFDFSLMPTSNTSESLGFNTEELTGRAADLNDPMTATINLAAVAALLGTNSSGPLDNAPASSSYDDYSIDAQPDAETSLSLGTPESWTPSASDAQNAQSQDATASSDASSDYSYPTPSEPLTEDVTPHPSWSQDVAPDLGLDAATGSETPDYSMSNEAATTQMEGTVTDLSPDSLQAEPGESSPDGGSWMASATTGLAGDPLTTSAEAPAHGAADQSDHDLSAKHALAVEGLDVAPFDLTQLEVEEEPPTGYLDAQEMKSKYGTASLEMADDVAHAHNAGAGGSNWSSENDTSYFASSTPTEVELSQAGNTSSFTSPLTSDLPMARKAGATDYLGEETVADVPDVVTTPAEVDSTTLSVEPLEVAIPPAAAPEMPTTPEESQDAQEAQPIKARVARGPWTSYSETTDFTMPAPQAHTQAQAKAQPEPVASSLSGPLFEQSVRLPSESDLMTSGPLPPVTGFDDLVGLVANNPQDIGAHMALASAYAQVDDLDSALRVYRRIIKKPTTSHTMLTMILDDLSDLSPQAQQLPRFYQLSGDLLLRLGRHREAVEAYNKLQSTES
ncbi:MAG: hypothetical protein ABJA50_01335 [Chloroflexota bacterium]